MQDLVALGTGNSRLMKSNIPSNTTLQQLIQMLNNGTFPYDIGPLNAAGISQQGTPLNKANLLSDVTAALLGGVNTPDAALAALKGLVDGVQGIAEGRARIEAGSYVGTGAFGSDNPNTLSFSFNPEIVFILGNNSNRNVYIGIFLKGLSTYLWLSCEVYRTYDVSSNIGSVNFSENSMSWYDDMDIRQLNIENVTYRYVALG